MASLSRPLAILELFEEGSLSWTVEEIGQALHIPASTVYRHVRMLVQAGLLDPGKGGAYQLGPAFIRYDRISRQGDELIREAAPRMRDLLELTTQSATVILCRRFKDCVMCVHEELGTKPHPSTSYERGIAMPMFRGASSKAILANLPDRNLRSIYLGNEKDIRQTGVKDWVSFKEQMRAIRWAGVAVTDSEVAVGRVGIAAPLFRSGLVIASLSMVFIPKTRERKMIPDFSLSVKQAAEALNDLSR